MIIIVFLIQMLWAEPLFQNGDIVFQKSKTQQSKAIEEATGSPWTHMGILFWHNNQWYVYEAVQPVSATSLLSFTERSKGHHIVVKRVQPQLIDLSRSDMQTQLKEELLKYYGLNYDLLFEWSDESIYCSELVWKGFMKAFGKSIGKVQRFKDLKLNGPYVKQLIKKRLKDTGRELDLQEQIITPVAMMKSEHLFTVYDSNKKALMTQPVPGL